MQGLLTALGLYLSGVPRAVLLGAIAGFLAVLPIGAPMVWIPAAVWLIGSGHTGWGIFLVIYGVVAVSGADHLIRPIFIARGAQLPFLLTVLGCWAGRWPSDCSASSSARCCSAWASPWWSSRRCPARGDVPTR